MNLKRFRWFFLRRSSILVMTWFSLQIKYFYSFLHSIFFAIWIFESDISMTHKIFLISKNFYFLFISVFLFFNFNLKNFLFPIFFSKNVFHLLLFIFFDVRFFYCFYFNFYFISVSTIQHEDILPETIYRWILWKSV